MLSYEQSAPQRLKSNLSEFYKLRIGDYRAIYEIESETQVLVIVRVRHRHLRSVVMNDLRWQNQFLDRLESLDTSFSSEST
ncbi:MAG: type II toxin-antitoxin system RelE/ParE family toxin [Phormidesmis sp. CAN_BIN44]|nr:type II toxin-antitoxin system RelE/ParE family toxin [Phormidesmis sp. CAN_BIN44]